MTEFFCLLCSVPPMTVHLGACFCTKKLHNACAALPGISCDMLACQWFQQVPRATSPEFFILRMILYYTISLSLLWICQDGHVSNVKTVILLQPQAFVLLYSWFYRFPVFYYEIPDGNRFYIRCSQNVETVCLLGEIWGKSWDCS